MIKYDTVAILLNDGMSQDCLSFLRYCYETHQAPSNSSLQEFYKHIENREWINKFACNPDILDKVFLKDFLIKVAKFMEEYDEKTNKKERYGAYTELKNWIKENVE